MNILDLADRHLGKVAFILGSGPSLNNLNIEDISDYVTFTVNSAICKLPDCDYFVSDDQQIELWSYFVNELKSSRCCKLFYRERLATIASKYFNSEEVVLFDHKFWFVPPDKYYLPEGLELTKDPLAPIIGARTSVGTAIHLAYIMGCDPIVLLGCDCAFEGSHRYFWQSEKYEGKKPYRLDAQIVNGKPIWRFGNLRGDGHCKQFIDYWENFYKVNHNKINVINASVDGALDVFPKMPIEDVLNMYGDRTK